MADTSFSDRLARIERGRGNAVLHVGDETIALDAWRRRQQQSRSARLLRNALFPLCFVAAFVLGLVGLALAVSVRAHFAPVLPSHRMDDMHLMFTAASGMLMAVVLGKILPLWRVGGRAVTALEFLGVLVGMAGIHNLAFWAPDLSAVLFTPNWVVMQLGQTNASTLILRGLELQF